MPHPSHVVCAISRSPWPDEIRLAAIFVFSEICLKLESIPTLSRPASSPAGAAITRRVAATIEVASSVVRRKEYCFRWIENNNIPPKHTFREERNLPQIETPPMVTLAKDRMVGNSLSEGGVWQQCHSQVNNPTTNWLVLGEILENLLCGKLDVVLRLYSKVIRGILFFFFFYTDVLKTFLPIGRQPPSCAVKLERK